MEVFLSKTFRKLWCISLEIRGRGVKQAIKVFHTRHHLPLSLSCNFTNKIFQYTRCVQKRVTFRTLLEPRCSITSSRHPSQLDLDEPVSGCLDVWIFLLTLKEVVKTRIYYGRADRKGGRSALTVSKCENFDLFFH